MTATIGGSLHIVREFDFPAQRVFDAWLDPRLAARWLFTTPASERHRIEADTRVGGKWKITDRREGIDFTATGEYLEIEPPKRLVFSFGMPQFSPGFARVTIEIQPAAEGACVLTLTHEPLAAEAVVQLKKGWAEMLDELGRCLKPTTKVHYLEIVASDVDAVCAAYEAAHEIEFGSADPLLGGARTAALAGGGSIGVRAPLRETEEPVVRPYWLVDDIEAALDAAVRQGAVVAHPALEIPGRGRFAIYVHGDVDHGLWQL